MSYRLYPNKNPRMGKIQKIILTQARNMFIKGSMLSNTVREGSTYKYTWGKWQDYYYKELKLHYPPVHYFVELLDKDYVVFKGLNEMCYSPFLQDLAYNGIIENRYANSLVIAIGEDFYAYPNEDRLMELLAERALGELMEKYGLGVNDVVYIDDILLPDWENKMQVNDIKYDIVKAQYFDRFKITKYVSKYYIDGVLSNKRISKKFMW